MELKKRERKRRDDRDKNAHLLKSFEGNLKGPSLAKNIQSFGKLGGKVYEHGKNGLKSAAEAAEFAAPVVSTIANIAAPGSGIAINAAVAGLKAANEVA